jgi:hypothetical protein
MEPNAAEVALFPGEIAYLACKLGGVVQMQMNLQSLRSCQAAFRTRIRNKSKPARSYIWCFKALPPRQFESGSYRGQIRLQPLSKCPQIAWGVGCQSVGQPNVEFLGLPVPHHIHKSCFESGTDSNFRTERLKVIAFRNVHQE